MAKVFTWLSGSVRESPRLTQNTGTDPHVNPFREAGRKPRFESFESRGRRSNECLHSIPEILDADALGEFAPMSTRDLIDSVVGPATANRHREFGSLEWKLVSAMSDDRPSR